MVRSVLRRFKSIDILDLTSGKEVKNTYPILRPQHKVVGIRHSQGCHAMKENETTKLVFAYMQWRANYKNDEMKQKKKKKKEKTHTQINRLHMSQSLDIESSQQHKARNELNRVRIREWRQSSLYNDRSEQCDSSRLRMQMNRWNQFEKLDRVVFQYGLEIEHSLQQLQWLSKTRIVEKDPQIFHRFGKYSAYFASMER